ncbi:HlyD family type I secretion periplasmic adaptor subunit [Aquincola sp. MAHUQ-54]|uniref:Membrane fusion protein (MFP) family protein n=1 Tax=Aquincola agrisoli TaxID=3119538 RepID=A0AAW9QFE9_9BURK
MTVARVDDAADLDAGPRRLAVVMVGLIVLFGAVALAWMMLAHIDVAVTARGAVVAPSRVQEVQSLEGGIVRALRVQPGDKVLRGQPLVQLDRVQYDADLGESRENQRALQAARIRIDALLGGHEPAFGALEAEAPAVVREERRLWWEARREYQAAEAASAEGVRRHAGELAEARARIQALEPGEAAARESLQIEEHLYQEGAGARADYLAARQRWLQQNGELAALRESLPRLQAALAEARAQGIGVQARARAQWSQQRTEIEGKLAALETAVAGRADKLARRELVSPMDGVVNRVLIPTQGGVAAPGAAILEIVPSEPALRISARVKPSDIGFIHVGQQATVRVAAFDASIYGTLDGEVERVGADVLLDENKQPYFEVQLRSARDHLAHEGRRLVLSPGMPTDASILTGRRTVMQYLLKPLLKTLDAALQER